MDNRVFDYQAPTESQRAVMDRCRKAAGDYLDVLRKELPESADKTYLIRKLREVAMWVNVTITRQPDGGPRQD